MMSALVPVVCEGLQIAPHIDSGTVTVKVSGTCDSRTTPVLERFLGSLHAEVVRIQGKRVILACEDLYFMNSATVKCFVIWLAKVKALPAPDRYHVSVRTNRFVAWHRRTFSAISRSAPDVFTVDA